MYFRNINPATYVMALISSRFSSTADAAKLTFNGMVLIVLDVRGLNPLMVLLPILPSSISTRVISESDSQFPVRFCMKYDL